MYYLSIYFGCVLILALVSCSIKILWVGERGGGYILYTGLFCGSLRGAWRMTGSSDSDNRACLSSKVYGLSWKEMRVDDWGYLFEYLLVLLEVFGCCWRGLVWGLLIRNFGKIFKDSFFVKKFYFYCCILRWKELKVLLLMRIWMLFYTFAYFHYEGCQKCEKNYDR